MLLPTTAELSMYAPTQKIEPDIGLHHENRIGIRIFTKFGRLLCRQGRKLLLLEDQFDMI